MVKAIELDVIATQEYIGKKALSADVMAAMDTVPRHDFIPAHLSEFAYENRPLPIGHEQTISQPYIVALMTDLLEPEETDRILEIGTGSGYQAAVLAELVEKVYSIEIVEPLGLAARKRLNKLGYGNVAVRVGDGYLGWPEYAPFDGIIVTAAATHIPQPLIEQLKPGGRIVIPVGKSHSVEQLTLLTKQEDGRLQSKQILPVVFVPLTRAEK